MGGIGAAECLNPVLTKVSSSCFHYFQRKAKGYSVASAVGIWARQRRREVSTLMALAERSKVARYLILVAVQDLCHSPGRCWRPARCRRRRLAGHDRRRLRSPHRDGRGRRCHRYPGSPLSAGATGWPARICPRSYAVLANARRHLEPGGRVVALVPADTFAGRLYRLFHRRHGFAITLFDRPRFALMAEQAGLAVLRSQAVFPFGDVHAMVPR